MTLRSERRRRTPGREVRRARRVPPPPLHTHKHGERNPTARTRALPTCHARYARHTPHTRHTRHAHHTHATCPSAHAEHAPYKGVSACNIAPAQCLPCLYHTLLCYLSRLAHLRHNREARETAEMSTSCRIQTGVVLQQHNGKTRGMRSPCLHRVTLLLQQENAWGCGQFVHITVYNGRER